MKKIIIVGIVICVAVLGIVFLKPARKPIKKQPYLGLSDPRWKEWQRWQKIDQDHDWKMPINFYGKVVDENEKPIEGAKVEFSWTDLSKAGSSQSQTISDKNGNFELRHKHGKFLQVDVDKNGYYTAKHASGFEYADFSDKEYYQPDPNNPVIFHLRKKGEGEPMYAGELQFYVPESGEPAHTDFILERGHPLVFPGGHMAVSVQQTVEPPNAQKPFDWSGKISMRDGGFHEFSNEEFPFTAPESGYQPEVDFDMPASDPHWKSFIEKDFYIKYGTPSKYGRIHMNLDGYIHHATITFYMNPSGSRNLELNPKTWINKSPYFDPLFHEIH